MDQIHHLNQRDYEEGALLALENAKGHFRVAEKSAEIDQFGIAVSLLVTASEELAKASVLKIKSLDRSIEIKNLDKYFKKHLVKHHSILSILSATIEHSLEFEDSKAEKHSQSTENNLPDFNKLLPLTIIVIVAILQINFNNEDSKKKDDPSDFETMRKDGLFFGFDPQSKQWKVPKSKFDRADYEDLNENLSFTILTIENSLFGDKINQEDLKKFANKLVEEGIIVGDLKEAKDNLKEL